MDSHVVQITVQFEADFLSTVDDRVYHVEPGDRLIIRSIPTRTTYSLSFRLDGSPFAVLPAAGVNSLAGRTVV